MLKRGWVLVSGMDTRDLWMNLLYDIDLGEQVVQLPGDQGQIRLRPVRIPQDIPIIPPWRVDQRLGDESFQQNEQGHGYHGWWESGKLPKDPTNPLAAGDTPQQDPGQATADFMAANPGGFTISTKDGSSPITGFNVGGVVAPLDIENKGDFTDIASKVEGYVQQNADLLAKPDMFLGGWQNPNGSYTIEVSQKIDNPRAAGQAAMDRNQYSFWDNAQAQENAVTKETGKRPDGTPYSPPPPGVTDKTLPNPEHLSYGTGDFGVVNPATDAGMVPITGKNGEGTITPSIHGREDASSAGMSQAYQDKMDATASFYGLPDRQGQADNVEKFIERASAAEWVKGSTFYPLANLEARKVETETGGKVSAYQAAGMIAALSPNTPVGSNMEGAHVIAGLVSSGEKMHFDPQVLADYNSGVSRATKDNPNPSPFNIQNDTALLKQPDRDAAAASVLLYIKENQIKEDSAWSEPKKDGSTDERQVTLMSGTSGIGKAIDIATGVQFGTDIPATPDTVLGSTGTMKERDFFNNIINPLDSRSVTIDGFELGIAKGTGAYTEKVTLPSGKTSQLYQAAITNGPQSMKDGVTSGIYPIIVDAVNKGTEQANAVLGTHLTNVQGQAVSWYVGRDEAKGNVQTAGNRPVEPTPVTPALQGRDLTKWGEGGAVLMAGPKDSTIELHTTDQLYPTPYNPANDAYEFTDQSAVDAKADVAARLADACTSTTEALMNAAIPQFVVSTPEMYLNKTDKEQRQAACSALISRWANTSNDSSAESLAMQSAAAKEFGLEENQILPMSDVTSKNTKEFLAQNGPALQDFLRAQYNDTQQMLKDQNVASITLYRGQRGFPESTTEHTDVTPFTTTTHQDTSLMRPISSWSSSYDTAAGSFAGDSETGGVIMTAQVPASQIMSCARTGFGCLNEHEFTVLGNVNNVEVTSDY